MYHTIHLVLSILTNGLLEVREDAGVPSCCWAVLGADELDQETVESQAVSVSGHCFGCALRLPPFLKFGHNKINARKWNLLKVVQLWMILVKTYFNWLKLMCCVTVRKHSIFQIWLVPSFKKIIIQLTEDNPHLSPSAHCCCHLMPVTGLTSEKIFPCPVSDSF